MVFRVRQDACIHHVTDRRTCLHTYMHAYIHAYVDIEAYTRFVSARKWSGLGEELNVGVYLYMYKATLIHARSYVYARMRVYEHKQALSPKS